MKELRSKIFWCLLPVVLGLLVIAVAWHNYGNPPLKIAGWELSRLKFKLGVDLVGGTILVYEIDPDKKPDNYSKEQLISALKRRLDPADLYNITIRPLSDTRVEIILPTGGRHLIEAQNKRWDDLLAAASKKWEMVPRKNLTAKRGEVPLLASQIRGADSSIDSKDIEEFIKKEYGDTSQRELTGDDVERIKELVQRVGSLEFRILADYEDDKEAIDAARKDFDKAANSWREFINAAKTKYGDSLSKAGDKDEKAETRDLTLADIACGDEASVLKLILARRPKEHESEVKKWMAEASKKSPELIDMMKRADSGVPPPSPLGIKGKHFDVTLKDAKHEFSYSWVELGKGELHTLGLNNEARDGKDDRSRSRWLEAAKARNEGKVIDLDMRGGIGAGFKGNVVALFSRKITNESRISAKDKADGKTYEYFFLTRDAEPGKAVTGEYLTRAGEGSDARGLSVDFQFNAKGGALFHELTSANVPSSGGDANKRYLAIVLDGSIMSAPSLNSPIRDRGQITGNFTRVEIDNLVNILRSGALPAALKKQPVSENTMGATLGDDTIQAGTYSIGIAFLAVLAFMLVYYRFAGFVACVALLANLILTIAFMVVVSATFTLPGLAGLVLTLAMAVDANILIYERLREERDRGASLQLALRNGYDRAFPTIIDTHLSSIFTAIVLYVVGNDQLKGFGISLTVGLLISLFTSLYMTKVMFRFWELKGWLKKLSMARLLSKTNINFMGIRRPVFIGTVIVSVLGLALFLARGPSSLNMDFVGGTVYSGVLANKQTTQELRHSLESEENHKKWLALDGEPVEGADGAWTLRYKEAVLSAEDEKQKAEEEKQATTEAQQKALQEKWQRRGREREIHLTEKVTPAQLRARAEKLEEPTIELIYKQDKDFSEDDKSRLFTVRTPEKARELVEASLGRLLRDNLERIRLKTYTIESVTLVFPEKKPLSLSQARLLLLSALQPKDAAQVEAARLLPLGEVAAEQLALEKFKQYGLAGKDEAGKGTWRTMTLTFTGKPADGAKILTALAPLTQGNDAKLASVQVSEARIELSGETYVSQVKNLIDRQLKSSEKTQTVLESRMEGIAKEGDRSETYGSMELKLPGGVEGDRFRKSMERFGEELASRPLPIRLENFDSQLASDMQQRALYAIVASWGAMLLYLWFRFGNWTFGMAAVLCLIHDVCFTLGCIALAHHAYNLFGPVGGLRDFKLDLPAVAALLTLIGFSVNDTIVVFDRIREVRGKNPTLTPEMINDSVNQTLSRTVLTSLTAWLVVLVLYIWGGDGVHLFAYVMVVGVVVGTYSSIFVASPLLLILGEGAPKPGSPQQQQKPREEMAAPKEARAKGQEPTAPDERK